MKCLYLQKPNSARWARLAAGIAVAASFVYAQAYEALGSFQSMPYATNFNFDIDALIMVFGYGLISYLLYYLLSGLVYNLSMNSCIRTTGIFSRPIDRGTFRLNLDVCYAAANVVIGSINLAYFYYPTVQVIGGAILPPLVVAAFMTLFYFMIRSRAGREYYFPLLSGMGIPFLIMLLLV